MLGGRILTAAVGWLLLCATTVSVAAAETQSMPPSGECTTSGNVTLCPGNARTGEASPGLPENFVGPGAVEPPHVDPVAEQEFWAHVDERKARGRQASPGRGELALYPPVEGGWVGWCAILRRSAHDGAHCPIAPGQGQIGYEQWEAAGTDMTQGLAIAPASVEAVAVDEETTVPLTPVDGLSSSLAAAVVTIPAPFPWTWFDEFEPVFHGLRNSGARGLSAPQFNPSISLPAAYWRAPQPPPPGACAVAIRGLKGAHPRWGHVVANVPSEPGIAGGGFTSCADTEISFQGSSLDVAVLLSAPSPGSTPPALPGASVVHGERGRGLVSAPGWAGEILARRVSGAWLVVEGGRGLRQRETVLAHVTAAVHL